VDRYPKTIYAQEARKTLGQPLLPDWEIEKPPPPKRDTSKKIGGLPEDSLLAKSTPGDTLNKPGYPRPDTGRGPSPVAERPSRRESARERHGKPSPLEPRGGETPPGITPRAPGTISGKNGGESPVNPGIQPPVPNPQHPTPDTHPPTPNTPPPTPDTHTPTPTPPTPSPKLPTVGPESLPRPDTVKTQTAGGKVSADSTPPQQAAGGKKSAGSGPISADSTAAIQNPREGGKEPGVSAKSPTPTAQRPAPDTQHPAPDTALKPIYFAFDRSTLRARDTLVLRANLERLLKTPDAAIEVNGYCDPRGSDEYNDELGLRRAEALKQWLVKHGVGADRIRTKSYGSSLVADDNPAFYWQERRSEIRIRAP
jgi:peptidoglycan-associated lipoprotein